MDQPKAGPGCDWSAWLSDGFCCPLTQAAGTLDRRSLACGHWRLVRGQCGLFGPARRAIRRMGGTWRCRKEWSQADLEAA